MRLLLDTHFLVWLATEADRISDAELKVLSDTRNDFFVSALSIWEIRIKWNAIDRDGRRKGSLSPETALLLANRNGFMLEGLLPEHPTHPLEPPLAHRDPFDEMLLVHAQRLDAKLLTRDRALIDHPLAYRFE